MNDELKEKHFNTRKAYNSYIRFFNKHKKVDDINEGIYNSLLDEYKIRRRLKYSIAFWFSFYIFSIHFISNQMNIKFLGKSLFYFVIFVPNIYFYTHKFFENRKEMHMLLLKYHMLNFLRTGSGHTPLYDKIIQDYSVIFNERQRENRDKQTQH
jgi:hypothetical protein